MKNQQKQMAFSDLLLNQNQHIKTNKFQFNSRYSLSYKQQDVISLNSSIVDQELQMQFSQIQYAIRMSKSSILTSKNSLLQTQKSKSNNNSQIPYIQFPSNTIQIQVSQATNPKKPSQFLLNFSNSEIPKIRLSNLPKQLKEQTITIMIILTSINEINKMKIILEDCKQKVYIPKQISVGFLKNNHIFITLITVYFQQFNNLIIKYSELSKKFIVFTSKMEKQVNLSQATIYSNAGLLFPLLQQQDRNVQLINYCILLAQQHLSYKIRQIYKQNRKLVKQFYYLFSKQFKPDDQAIINIFQRYQPSTSNLYAPQFFLYFLFMIYRQNAISKIYQFDLLDKIQIDNHCRSILQLKYYDLFENGHCFKQFLLYVYFLVALHKKEQFQHILSILKYNILHQNQLQTKRIILKALQVNQKLLKISNMLEINSILIKNKEISFIQYLQIKLKGIKAIVKGNNRPSQDKMNSILLQFLGNLILKMKENNPSKQDDFKQFSQLIVQIYTNKGKLIIKDQYIAQSFAKIKFIYRCSPQAGKVFLDSLKGLIFDLIPRLLQEQYEAIIHPLLLKPESPQQNKILLQFFQNKQITSVQIMYLLQIWLQKKIELYNFLTIQFVILKFMAVNKNFQNMDLEQIIKIANQYIQKEEICQNHRKNIYIFCQRMKKEMGHNEKKDIFRAWLEKSLFRYF